MPLRLWKGRPTIVAPLICGAFLMDDLYWFSAFAKMTTGLDIK
jgi:hypothetical protein